MFSSTFKVRHRKAVARVHSFDMPEYAYQPANGVFDIGPVKQKAPDSAAAEGLNEPSLC